MKHIMFFHPLELLILKFAHFLSVPITLIHLI